MYIVISIISFFQLCDTYPRHLFIPRSVSSSVLIGSSKFRSKGRLPVLSYLHRNKVTTACRLKFDYNLDIKLVRIFLQAVICRCSQPLSGFNARCINDEQFLCCILKSNPNSDHLYVVDTRPKVGL